MNAAEFLQTLYGSLNDGWLENTFIAPPELNLYPRTMVLWKPLPLGEIDPRMPKIQQMNAQGWGCYFGLAVRRERKYPEDRINTKTGEKYHVEYPRGFQKDAKYLSAFFIDVDNKDFGGDATQALRQVESIHPSIVVQSGGGYHGYLVLRDPLLITDDNRADVKRTLKGMAKTVGSDPHVAELARVFRLPDTVNTKPDRGGVRCQVVQVNPVRYEYDDLFQRYALIIPENNPSSYDRTYFVGDDEVEKALNCIPAHQVSYDDWIRVLAGLTHSLGSDRAARLGESWSGYCSQSGEIESKVASFSGDTGSQTAMVGSVFYLAKQYGYVPPTHEERDRKSKLSAGSAIDRLRQSQQQAALS